MKYLISFLLIASSFFGYTQNADLNQYKYVIVNNQYDFQNEANEYSFNELIVFELKKHNFRAFRNSEVLPADMNRGECNALQLKVDKSGTLRIFMVMQLVDCTGTVVFTSKKGVGKTKSNDKAYFEAIRDAMTSFDEVYYEYVKPYHTKALPNSELKAMGIDSILTMSGRPGNYNEQNNDGKVPLPPEPEFVQLVGDVVYSDKSSSYFIALRESKFYIYKDQVQVGYLKESKGGCYLAVATNFIGIGYKTAGGISIEHTTDGKEQVMEFVKQ